MAWPFDNQGDTQSVLPIDYGVQKFSNYINNALPNNQTTNTVTSNYPGANRPLNTLDPNWQNELAGYGSTMDRGNIDNRGFNFPSIFGSVKGGLEWLGDKFQRPEAKQKAYEAIMGDRKGLGVGEVATGTYGGTGYDLQQTPSGLKVYSDVNPYGKNFDSMFGSQSLEEMDEKTLAWAAERERTGKAISQRLKNILKNRRVTTTGVDVDRVGDNIPIGPRAVDTGTTGGRSQGDYQRAPIHSASEALSRGVDVRATGMMGPGGRHYAQGGRIGYQDGEFVEDINVEGPGFDENVMMASDDVNDRILESLYEEHYDRLKGLGHDDEAIHEIIMGMFEEMSTQAPDSEEQGIASLV